DQERAVFLHRVATVAENREALLLGPVVDDVREDVGVSAGRNALEEVPRLDRDAIRDAAGREHPAGLGDDVGPIEEAAARTLVTGEDRGEEVPGSPADVHDRAEAREVVGGRDRGGLAPVDAYHGVVEVGRGLGILREVVERAHAPGLLEGGLSSSDRVLELL